MATITSTSCGTSNIVQGAGTTPNNSYYLNSNPSGFITSSDVAGRFIGQRYSLPSGSSLYRINFPTTLSSITSTVVTELLNSGSGMASFTSVIRDIDTAGLYIEFSNTLGTGYSLMSNYISGSTAAGAFITISGFGGSNGSGVTYLNGLTDSINLVGINNTIYTSGNNIVISGSASGSINESNLVHLNGTEVIIGDKTFLAPIQAYRINDTGVAGGNQVIDCTARTLFDLAGNDSVHFDNRQLHNSGEVVTLDWEQRILSGNWKTNTAPTSSGDIINKNYFDSATGRLQPSGSYVTGVIAGTNITVSNNGSGGFIVNSSAAGGGNVTSVGGLTGIIGITGVSNITSYLSGNNIILSGINTGQFITTGQTGSFGATPLTNVVFTTGAQTILGVKSFTNLMNIYSGVTIYNNSLNPIAEVNSQTGSFKIYYPNSSNVFMDNTGIFRSATNSVLINVNSGALYDNSLAVALDWDDRQLSGQWQTNTLPTISGHIINKGYLDSITGSLGGGSTIIQGSGISTTTGAGSVTINIRNDYDQFILMQRVFN